MRLKSCHIISWYLNNPMMFVLTNSYVWASKQVILKIFDLLWDAWFIKFDVYRSLLNTWRISPISLNSLEINLHDKQFKTLFCSSFQVDEMKCWWWWCWYCCCCCCCCRCWCWCWNRLRLSAGSNLNAADHPLLVGIPKTSFILFLNPYSSPAERCPEWMHASKMTPNVCYLLTCL